MKGELEVYATLKQKVTETTGLELFHVTDLQPVLKSPTHMFKSQDAKYPIPLLEEYLL